MQEEQAQEALIARYDQRIPRYTSYPTAPHFSNAIGASDYAAWLGSLDNDASLSVYLHVPFCAELCYYCGCHTSVARTYRPVAQYVDLLLREIDLVANATGGVRNVRHVHWGGGTPTMLSAHDIARVMAALQERFHIGGDAEVAVEIDPRTFTRDQACGLAKMGLTRASLGVQDLNAKVQQAVNRIQSFEQTQAAAAWLREAGARSLNIDLMYGLPHQSVASVTASVAKALELDPDRIALFGYAHVPWMKRHQALIPDDTLPGVVERLRQMNAASSTIVEAGYVAIGLDHFAKPDDPLAAAQRSGELHRNFQGYTTDRATALIGLGVSAIGALPQGYVQNPSSVPLYRKAMESGRLATARGVRLSCDDRIRRNIIERLMCDLVVDLNQVTDSGDARRLFAPELERLAPLARDGFVQQHGMILKVPDQGRPFVRAVCAVFDRYLGDGEARYSRAV